MHPVTPSTCLKVGLRRIDNRAERKVGILLCNQAYTRVNDVDGFPVGEVFEARHKTLMMETFMKETLGFDAVQTHTELDLAKLDRTLNDLRALEIEPWLANENRKGKLLIFVYFMGFWVKTSGSQIYSVRGETINLD